MPFRSSLRTCWTTPFWARRTHWPVASAPTLGVAWKRFLVDRHRRATALKRGGSQTALCLDGVATERTWQANFANGRSEADAIYQQSWAESVLRHARARLAAEYGDPRAEADF